MAMGGAVDENGGEMANTRPSSSSSSSSSTRSEKEYLRRLGSRSLTEEHSRASTHSDESVDAANQRNSLPGRVTPGQEAVNAMARHGSDTHLNDRYYAGLRDSGQYVKMGWLTKQGHVWKNWKNRFFVLFHDGTLAYYKAKSKRRMKGCMKLNEGVVSVQHVDVRRSSKPHVIQIEKGFYRMWCHCISQAEAELWVNALRSVRQNRPPCFEPVLTLQEEQLGHRAVTAQLNKIFVTDERIQSMVTAFTTSISPQTLGGTYDFIERLEDTIMNKYVGFMYMDPTVPMLSGNEVLKFIRRHIEDRAFVPVAAHVYSNLNHTVARAARSKISKSLKALKHKSVHDFGLPEDIATISSDWTSVRVIVETIDCMSLPSHKIDMVLHAGSTIYRRVAERLGADHDVSDEVLSSLFRFIIVHSNLDDLAIIRALLEPIYPRHPSCQSQAHIVKAFIEAIAWIEGYQQASADDGSDDAVSLASARVSVSISTPEVGILFTTDGNGRGAIVHSVRKLSQASLSEVIVPGLSLIAINDEPVILMPFREICQRLRTAALPKKLTFLPEFFYYQLLSLDHDMYSYLLCLAARRGDHDSVTWLIGSQLDVNEPCSWEKTRGAQILGCKLPSSDEVGGYALHAAAQGGHAGIVDYLLRLDALPDQSDRRGRTALHLLSTSTLDIVSIMEALHGAGASLDATDREGMTPLMAMAQRGSIEAVTTLLALGADLGKIAWSTGFTALEYAVSVGATAVVELLLSKHADPNHATLDGDTTLHLAAARADPAIVQLLLDAGARPNQLNRFSQTPAAVMLAQAADDAEATTQCLILLVEAGCELHRPDLLGRSLVHLAQLANNDSAVDVLHRHSEADNEPTAVDIFGCGPHDYTFDCRIGTEFEYHHARDPRYLWLRDSSRQSHRPSAKPIEELLHRLLHDISVDLCDLVAFAVFFESIATVETVLKHVRELISNGSKSRNMLRFVVVLLLFKLPHIENEDSSIVKELHALVDRHRRLLAYTAAVMVDEYRAMFERLFSRHGSVSDQYASIPIAMQQRYGLEQPAKFDAAFPRNLYLQLEPSQWAEHCTLVTHSLFCSIPVEDLVSLGGKSTHSSQFLSAKRWFQHLSAYVINSVLVEDRQEVRARVIAFFLSAAEWCLTLRNYDTLAAILYALQSTAVQRLRRTMDCLPLASKKLLNQMQGLSDKGCRDINKLMHAAASPSMPYIGLYLQGFVGLNELPVFEKGSLVNGHRLRKLGELVVEVLRRRATAYQLPFHPHIDSTLHVDLPYATDESRYAQSLQLEPREAGAAPLGERMTYVDTEDLDIDSEVRESIGSEGTFGIRQWFRMQKVVHRNRSRSSAASYEWV